MSDCGRFDSIRQAGRRILLHVGCGPQGVEALPPLDFDHAWQQIRVDLDPAVEPDVRTSIIGLEGIPDGAVDCLFSKHNLEHVEHHQIAPTLAAFARVLKPDGVAIVRVPDLQQVARHIAGGDLDTPLFTVERDGDCPISPIDIVYGLRVAIAAGNPFMAHRTGFTATSLGRHLGTAGFQSIYIDRVRNKLELCAVATKIRVEHALHYGNAYLMAGK